MPSQFENPELDHFFQRLNKPLAKMPVQERADVHAEIRQHLDALIAAHGELGATPNEALEAAIKQFGDPAKVSKRLVREWRRANHQKNPFWAAFWHMSLWKSVMLALSFVYAEKMPGADPMLPCFLLFFISPLLAGFITGWKMPKQAASGAFYSGLAFTLIIAAFVGPNLSDEIIPRSVVALDWLAISFVGAYVGSAQKRGGFYRLRRADFALPLSFKRRAKRLA